MRQMFVTRAAIGWGAFIAFLLVLAASQFFRAPMTDTDRTALAARYAHLSDTRLREVAETADPEAQEVIRAELARRGK